ncbi:MAG: beta-ketoacyl-[acyl-carrier-protein] synthase II, partial [Actinobacteria bacterium]|nr:beta-ketoacyl-[acyl-carrier-protein] synthase II [Actinomycetota bacterium]
MKSKNNNERRVVITGMGVVTSIGSTIKDYWENLISGKSGVSRVKRFDVSKISSRIAAQIEDFEPKDYMSAKQAKRMDRFSQLGVAAAKMTVEDSGLKINSINCSNVGVYIGSGVGGLKTIEE